MLEDVAEELREAVGPGEAPAGSRASERLADALSRILRGSLHCSPVHVRLPVYRWEDNGSRILWGGRLRRAYALPPEPPSLTEAVTIHVDDPLNPESWAAARGRVAVAEAPPAPWLLDKAYHLAASARVKAVIFYTEGEPPRWSIGYYPYTAGHARTPLPALITDVHEAPPEGVPVRVEERASGGWATGRAVLCGDTNPELLLVTHHDYLGPEGAGVIEAVAAAVEMAASHPRAMLVSLPMEAYAPPTTPVWWGYSASMLRNLLHADPGAVIYLDSLGAGYSVSDCGLHGPGGAHTLCMEGFQVLEVKASEQPPGGGARHPSLEELLNFLEEPRTPPWYPRAPLPLRRSLYRLLRLGAVASPCLTLYEEEGVGGSAVLDSTPLSVRLAEAPEGARVVDVDGGRVYVVGAGGPQRSRLVRVAARREAARLDALYIRRLLAGRS